MTGIRRLARTGEACRPAHRARGGRFETDADKNTSITPEHPTMADALRQQETLLKGVQMIADGSLSVNEGRWKAPGIPAEFGVRLKPLLKYLRPLYDKLAELITKLTREREALAEERSHVASTRARAGEMLVQLETIREQLNTEQAVKVEQVRDELNLSP